MNAPFPQDEVAVLLHAVRNGDINAFSTLYECYSKGVLSKLRRMVKIESEADEILQQVFVRVWERRAQIDPEQAFHSYLHRIAERLVYDFYRRLSRENNLRIKLKAEVAAFYTPTDDFQANRELLHLIDQAVNSLSPQRKKVFMLCRMEGKSYKEAGELLNLSPNTVHNHLVKASGLVKDYLVKSGILLFPPLLSFLLFPG